MALANANDMQKTFKLPLIPGNTCGAELLRTNFRKTQALSGTGEKSLAVKSVPIDFDSTNVSATASVGKQQAGATIGTGSMTSTMGNTQSLDRRVLRFFGYFQETVPESALEKARVRRVTICYFLEDDTISVSEPRQDNSGIAFQGCMVKRHQIPKADGAGLVSFQDLAVGCPVTFYGRTYQIIDCDAFTREFMSAVGMEMAAGQGLPSDPYSVSRAPKEKPQVGSMQAATNAAGMKVKLSASEVRAAKQFFENDRKVLKLRAMWDDRKNLYGEKHDFAMYYFLADDSIELVEQNGPNDGKDPFPSFCRRQRITKPQETKSQAGLSFGQKEATANLPFYTTADLCIGAKIVIFGREFVVYDYDKFTRDFLREHHGVTEYQPLQVKDAAKAPVRREPPPYNGFGSEEDSLSSWKSLDLRPPRLDNTNFNKYGDAVVKYALRLDNGVANDETRRFVLSCFLADSTIAIFETVARNSGITGGKFLQRQKVANPATNKPFVAGEFFVGQRISINKFPFVVISTDERSLAFMEQNSTAFPKSNINAVVHKIQAMLLSAKTGLADAFIAADAASKPVNVENMANVFAEQGLDVCEQEVITVLRFFERNGDTNLNFEVLMGRLLDVDDQPATDNRSWEVIHAAATSDDTEALSVADKVTYKAEKIETTTAAYAARTFMEQYANRRQLFHSEFRFVTDYSADGKIGDAEFRQVVVAKLRLPLNDAQVNALSHKMFPPGSRRLVYEDFLRLINNVSNYDHNLTQIKERR